MTRTDELTCRVKALALKAGFARVGIAPVAEAPHGERLDEWLARGWHAGMGYMARNVEKRKRPELLVPGACSVICLAAAYAPREGDIAGEYFIARYARGRDYHKVLKKRCRRLMDRIREIAPEFAGRAFVDSAPVAERSLAAAAGLGWIGLNGCLIVPGLGSYVVLCEVVCNLPLVSGEPTAPQCGDCRACAAACPTGALSDQGLVDCRKCISYLTIEHRGEIEPQYREKIGNRLFGCDTCQEVCPHNRGVPRGDAELTPKGKPLGGAGLVEIFAWTQDHWDAATRGSPLRRAGYERLLRNAAIVASNSGPR